MPHTRGIQPLDLIRKQENAAFRMEQGLISLLSLHTANELSSICGNLRLKILQKASVSVSQIMQFVQGEKRLITKEKADLLLKYLWEQPIIEYMRSIGHPVQSLSSMNPRDSVLAMWMEGGLIETRPSGGYAPYFIARDIKKRYLTVEAPDILESLGKLRVQQEKSKDVEKLILGEGSDFRHIPRYFKEMAELRVMESTFRDHLLSELDVSRAQMDSRYIVLNLCCHYFVLISFNFFLLFELLHLYLEHPL